MSHFVSYSSDSDIYIVKMFRSELDNFLVKFHQLRQAGFTAHLDLDANAGQAWVGLRVMLGPCQQQYHHHYPKHRSPSYHCRQERRKAARDAEQDTMDAEEATNVVHASDKASESEKKDAEKVSNTDSEAKDFKCELCNFSSKGRFQ